MRAAIYSRYSSDNQREASIEDQLRICQRRADAEGFAVTVTFADAAISGSDATRPQYQALLAAAGRQDFDVLLLEDLSRLTRDSVEQERTIRRLEFHGTRIIGVKDGYDSQSKARKVHRGIKGLMNELHLDDLSEKTHRGLEGQAIKGYWCGGRPYGYRLKPILDAAQTDAYGQPARIGTVLEINDEQAVIVREIFERYVGGESCRTIATDLNLRGIASSGSTWRRKVRRCSGWTASAVRVIAFNDLYCGKITWNSSQFVKDPDTGRHQRRARPRAEWNVHCDERLRIVSDATFQAAQDRTRDRANSDTRLKSGGKPKFLLSGLLSCNCGSHFVMADDRAYRCGSSREGACSSRVRVNRKHTEAVIRELFNQYLAPARVKLMAREYQREYTRLLRETQTRASELPREARALDARIARLRERQRVGDPDMAAADLQAVIDRLLGERARLDVSPPAAIEVAKIVAMLPDAAERCRKQIKLGLDGNPAEGLKARAALRKLCGRIVVESDDDGSVWARFDTLHPAALLLQAAGSVGRGDRI